MRASVEVAAAAGNPQVFHRLLDNGASISELCTPDATRAHGLLCSAAKGGSMDIFSFLVATGGFLALTRGHRIVFDDQQRYWGRAILIAAALGGSVAILSSVLDIDDGFLVLVDMRDDVDDMGWDSSLPLSPLHFARHARFAAANIEAGAPLEYKFKIQGTTGGTALETAVSKGHEEVVLELLSAGADINTRDSYVYPDVSLLWIAVEKNNEGMVDVLLAAGVDLGGDRAKNLPLHAAALRGYCGPLEKLLLAGANANWVDATGRSALHVACSFSNEDAVGVLLRHNASVTSLCDEGLSPHDVVAGEALKQQEMRERRGYARRSPSTLDAAQTLVADNIHGMLRGASSWARRGWLVMLRARRQGAAKAVDVSSLTLLSSSTKSIPEDQIPAFANEDAGDRSTLANV